MARVPEPEECPGEGCERWLLAPPPSPALGVGVEPPAPTLPRCRIACPGIQALSPRTSNSMRLNSSKHAHAPQQARPLKNLPWRRNAPCGAFRGQNACALQQAMPFRAFRCASARKVVVLHPGAGLASSKATSSPPELHLHEGWAACKAINPAVVPNQVLATQGVRSPQHARMLCTLLCKGPFTD
jgi:hypothetical protein